MTRLNRRSFTKRLTALEDATGVSNFEPKIRLFRSLCPYIRCLNISCLLQKATSFESNIVAEIGRHLHFLKLCGKCVWYTVFGRELAEPLIAWVVVGEAAWGKERKREVIAQS